MSVHSFHPRLRRFAHHLVIPVAVLAGLAPQAAHALDICESDPPAIDTSDPCSIGGTPVCSLAPTGGGTYKWVCNLDNNDELVAPYTPDKPAVGVAVFDDNTSGTPLCDDDYCAWGTTTSDNDFYCYTGTSSGNLQGVTILGGADDDAMFFWYNWVYAEDGQGNSIGDPVDWGFDLQEFPGFSLGMPFIGHQDGQGHEDELQGSRRDADEYVDDMFGNIGSDQICTYEGDDVDVGGDQTDYICPGDGNDYANGQGGADRILVGNSTGGVNNLLGGPDDDIIWDGSGDAGTIDGQGDSGGGPRDQCGGASSPTKSNCETTITSSSSVGVGCRASP